MSTAMARRARAPQTPARAPRLTRAMHAGQVDYEEFVKMMMAK
jgi:hypothetical protein